MKKKIAVVIGVVIVVLALISASEEEQSSSDISAASTITTPQDPSSISQDKIDPIPVTFQLGTFVTPRDFPLGLFDNEKMVEYYNRTEVVGEYTGSQVNWYEADNTELESVMVQTISDAKKRGLKYVLQMNLHSDPIGFAGTPPSISGSSFTDERVKEAYTQWALHLAAFEPDVLLLAVELNNLLFHGSKDEFDAFEAYAPELYRAVKNAHPQIDLGISFQVDHMRLRNEFNVLEDFVDSVDFIGVSSYPTVFGMDKVTDIPNGADYYTDIRDYLPAGTRIIVAESGWQSRGGSSESAQKMFYQKLPELYKGLRPELVMITYLHDFSVPSSADKTSKAFSSMGLRYNQGDIKPAWQVVDSYRFE